LNSNFENRIKIVKTPKRSSQKMDLSPVGTVIKLENWKRKQLPNTKSIDRAHHFLDSSAENRI
jgi:hypothetical protein